MDAKETAGAQARILIGPMSNDPTESVSSVNRAFVQGLKDRYAFYPLRADRKLGGTRQARLNALNGLYFGRQLWLWGYILLTKRPAIAHYAVSAGWAMEKGLMFMRLARLCGVKTLAHLHSGGFPDHWRALPPWRKKRAEKQFARLDGLVLASEWWRDQVGGLLPIPRKRLYVVNNPIDAEFEAAALAMPLERKANVVLAVGAMGRAKGVFDILTASEMMGPSSDAVIKLAGVEREPNILRDVKDHIAQRQLTGKVECVGPVDPARKIELFREASILLLPSYYENFPLTVVEAAAAGMAIITTPVGATPEFFHDGISALFVEPGNGRQIAEAVTRLTQNPAQRLKLAEAARRVFSTRLARARIVDSLDAIYRSVLQKEKA